MRINKILKLIRLSKRITQKEVAKQLGISTSYLSELENEKKEYSLALFLIICNVLHVKGSEVLLIDEWVVENNLENLSRADLIKELFCLIEKMS